MEEEAGVAGVLDGLGGAGAAAVLEGVEVPPWRSRSWPLAAVHVLIVGDGGGNVKGGRRVVRRKGWRGERF